MRPVAGVYLLRAVGGFAASVGRVGRDTAALEVARRRGAFLERGVTAEVLEALDADGNGQVTRATFLRYMLVASGQVEEAELAKLDALFDQFDQDGSGSLDADDIKSNLASARAKGPYLEVTTSSDGRSSGPESPTVSSTACYSGFELQAQHSEDSEDASRDDAGATLLQKARRGVLGPRGARRS